MQAPSGGFMNVELILLALTAIATVIGTVGGLWLQHQGNKHFAEQNRIMIEQAGAAKPQPRAFKPPYWPLIAMGGMVVLCWGAALYDRIGRPENESIDWVHYPLNQIEGKHFENQTVDLDGNEYRDVTFENVTFKYEGKAPTRFSDVKIVTVQPGKLAGRIASNNPVVMN